MKKWIIGVGTVLILAAAIFVGYQLLSFPAEEYAEAALDAMYKEEFEDYSELTGADSKEIAQAYEEGMEQQAEVFQQYFGITSLSKEGQQKLDEFVRMVYDYVEYEAAGSKKQGENRVVTVRVRPIAFYKILNEKKFAESFRQKTEDGEYLKLSEEQYQDEYLSQLVKEYEKAFAEGTYETLKEEEYTLTLKRTGSRYVPDSGEFAEIDQALFAFSK
ncbi:MAG: hypothetical protein HFI75_04400 [Lachnospiraceae bacterium]|nr:hypothetical protein [Lachnospiraceae bacterium]